MGATSSASAIAAAIKAVGSDDRAVHEKGYLKSNRIHWGCAFGEIDKIAKANTRDFTVDDIFQLADEFWKSGVFDLMVAAAGLLALKKVPTDDRLWTVLDQYINDATNWAEADRLARAAHRWVSANPDHALVHLRPWVKSDRLWRKRAALVFTLPLAKPNQNPEVVLGWMAEHYVTDQRWFIQKGIGWWLRTLAPNDPDRVVNFLGIHWPHLKGIARREATRRLPIDAKTALKHQLGPEWGFKS